MAQNHSLNPLMPIPPSSVYGAASHSIPTEPEASTASGIGGESSSRQSKINALASSSLRSSSSIELAALGSRQSGANELPTLRPRSHAVIGVMGGMGPAAGVYFSNKLIELRGGVKSSREHVRVLLEQVTEMPDRTAAILAAQAKDKNSGTAHVPSPVPFMRDSLRRLDAGGASVVAVTCNTAHHFYGAMQQSIDRFSLNLTLMHIVDASLAELWRQKPEAKRVGLLATSGTLNTKIYESRAEQLKIGIDWIYPDQHIQQDSVMAGIYDGVKAGKNDMGKALLLEGARHLKDKGVDAILLACTEIPLVLKTGDLQDKHGDNIPMIDTLGALASAALEKIETLPGRIETPLGGYNVANATLSAFVHRMSQLILGEGERPRRIGVMGGMPAREAVQFSDYVVTLNHVAKKDQDHVHLILDQATDIPDPLSAISTEDPDKRAHVVAEMEKSLKRLVRAGADDIVVVSNAANFFYPELTAAIARHKLKVRVANVAEVTLKQLDKIKPEPQCIGLLAPTGLVESRVFQRSDDKRAWLTPSSATQNDAVMPALGGIARNGHDDLKTGEKNLRRAAQELADRGADAIVVASAEIPRVLKNGDIVNKQGRKIPLVDTLEAQALDAIERARVPVPATPALVRQVIEMLKTTRPAHPLLRAPSMGRRPALG